MDPGQGFGDRLRQFRARAGMSRPVLSGLVGRSAEWLKAVETGRLAMPRLEMLIRLCEARPKTSWELTSPHPMTRPTGPATLRSTVSWRPPPPNDADRQPHVVRPSWPRPQLPPLQRPCPITDLTDCRICSLRRIKRAPQARRRGDPSYASRREYSCPFGKRMPLSAAGGAAPGATADLHELLVLPAPR
jgi:transcriptional regulator with XRE-family HTH domain